VVDFPALRQRVWLVRHYEATLHLLQL